MVGRSKLCWNGPADEASFGGFVGDALFDRDSGGRVTIFRNAFNRDGCCPAVAAVWVRFGLGDGRGGMAVDGAAAPELSRSVRQARADGRARFDPLAEAGLNPVPGIA